MNTIPADFKRYFWDTNIENLDLQKHQNYIIERLLEFGDFEQIDWINKSYNREIIKSVLMSSKRISPKTGNFFSLIYNFPKEEMQCMKKRYI